MLRKHRAIIDIEGEHLLLGGREGVPIPFISPERVPLCWRDVLGGKSKPSQSKGVNRTEYQLDRKQYQGDM